jgi:hypothetical protein
MTVPQSKYSGVIDYEIVDYFLIIIIQAFIMAVASEFVHVFT